MTKLKISGNKFYTETEDLKPGFQGIRRITLFYYNFGLFIAAQDQWTLQQR